MPLDLLNVPFAEKLSVFNQLVTDCCGFATIDKRILMLPELRLYRANLQIHLALVPRFVHLFGKDLLHSESAARVIIIETHYCTFRVE